MAILNNEVRQKNKNLNFQENVLSSQKKLALNKQFIVRFEPKTLQEISIRSKQFSKILIFE